MRKVLSILTILLMVMTAQAGPIDRESALAAAKSFVNSRSTSGTPGRRAVARQLTMTDVATPSPYLYAFNVGTDAGFVIVTADSTASVVGYSDEGQLNADDMPEALQFYLQCIGAQVKQAIDEGQTVDLTSARSTTSNGARRAAVVVKDPIAPLCSCHWAQTLPFNFSCPTSSSTHCLVGCVPLAMAQVMYHYKYPTDYADWGNMQDYYPASSNYSDSDTPSTIEQAVADFLYKCGKALNVSYGTSVTTGYSSNIPNVLKELGYSSSCQNVMKSSYTEAAFINLIYNELSNNRPVVLGGYTYSNSGHAWVCDGYSQDNYFHMNWGFNNGSDGYYTLANVSPTAQGAGGADTNNGYSSNMNAVIGITYDGAEGGVDYTGTANTTTSSTNNLVFTNASCTSAEFVVTVTNNGSSDYTGTWSVKSGNANGSSLGSDGVYIGAGETVTISIAFSGSTSTGTKMYLCSGNTALANSTLSTGGINSGVQISISSPVVVKNGGSGKYRCVDDEVTVSVTVKNTNSTAVSGYIMADLYSWNSSYTNYTQTTGMNEFAIIPAEEEYTATMTLSGIQDAADIGCYTIECYTYDNTSTSYSANDSTVTITIYHSPGYAYWTEDGTYNGVKAETAGTTLNVPESAVAVYIATGNISAVVPNSNPNTLYYIADGVTTPSGLDGYNIITGSGYNWSASSVTFKETSEDAMSNIYIPKKFTAGTITYARTFTKGRGNTTGMGSGWSTIALPFTPTSITNDGEELPFFTSASDTKGRFWLYRYNQVDSNTITLDYPTAFKANIPYLIAVPNDEWTSSLLNQTINFSANNVTVMANPTMVASTNTYNLKFVGTQEGTSVTNAYTMNADGSGFTYNTSATAVKPFHAYYTTNSATVNALPTNKSTLNVSYASTINDVTAVSSKITLEEATNITSSGFTTSWNAVSTARSYELTLTGVKNIYETVTETVTETIPGITALIEENFSGFNQESSGFGGTPIGSTGQTAATNSIDNYTGQSGWTGNAIYTASTNAARFGTTNTARGTAFMTTPSLTAPTDGNITIAVWASQYSTNDNTSMTVSVGSTKVGTFTPSSISTYTKDNATCYLFNTTVSDDFTVKVSNSASGKRSIVYYIGVYPGTYTTAAAITAAQQSTTEEREVTYDKIVDTKTTTATYTTTNTTYTFTGLDNDYTYTCQVRGVNRLLTGAWSNAITVNLLEDDPNATTKGDINNDGEINISDLTVLVDIIQGNASRGDGKNYNFDAAHINDDTLNDDTQIDESDITALINMILNR